MNISQRVFIGKKINKIYTMSMYIDRELINENIVIFLNFNNNSWVKIYSNEESLEIIKINSIPTLKRLEEFEDSFAYPICEYNFKYCNLKIINTFKYKSIHKNITCGVIFEFEKNEKIRLKIVGESIFFEIFNSETFFKKYMIEH
jgi:hypothetical protein